MSPEKIIETYRAAKTERVRKYRKVLCFSVWTVQA
jgi:hypothetical protein